MDDLHEHQPEMDEPSSEDSTSDTEIVDGEQGEPGDRAHPARLYWQFIRLYKPHLDNLVREATEINTAMHGGGYEDEVAYCTDLEDAIDRCIWEMMDTAIRAHRGEIE